MVIGMEIKVNSRNSYMMFPYRLMDMVPGQLECLNQKLDSNILLSGGPCTGKTVLAIMRACRYIHEGKSCLYIASSLLCLKFIRHEVKFIEAQELQCKLYKDFVREDEYYDIIILDDAHLYSLEQITVISSHANNLFILGDYSHVSHYDGSKKACDAEIVQALNCEMANLWFPSFTKSEFLRLVPRFTRIHFSGKREYLPVIERIGSLTEQCDVIRQIVEQLSLKDVGILCYTRKQVKTAWGYLSQIEYPIEAFLPWIDGIDTFNFDSQTPKITTIASARGLHFKTVFIIGFDSKVVWNKQEEVLEIAVARALERLYIFYEHQLPAPLANLSPDAYENLRFDDLEL